ncbi:cyclodeaminase [Niallia sp. JL1B1071]|uniref:cyclodeaminase n=1 Tax=Niallia tiangongensis TaxID=3237105 RepID=UPI0037DC4322
MFVFEEQEIRKYISINREIIVQIEGGFTKLARKEINLPPILRMDFPTYDGEVDVKTAYVQGMDSFAIKISSGFFQNHILGLPSLSGMMVLLSAKTGLTEALLLDNGYLTEVRTAAAGAVAAKHLAKEQVEVAGVIGTGMQARVQMEALYLVRPFKTLLVYGRNRENVERYKEEMESKLPVKIIMAESVEEVVRKSDVVVTTTPSTVPLIRAEWLHPGLHITAMGSDAEHKQEIDPLIFQKVDVVVCDVKEQSFRLGELHHVRDELDMDGVIELGEITSLQKNGRVNEEQVTICDLTGTGVQDTICAYYAYNLLKDKSV